MYFINKSNDIKVSMIEIIKYIIMFSLLKVLKYFEGELILIVIFKGICKYIINVRLLF